MSRLLFSSFEAQAVVSMPSPAPTLPFATAFGALLLAADRLAMSLLGGQPVIYSPESGSPVTITGIFDAVYLLAKGTADAGVESLGPAVFLRLEDIPVDPEDDDPTLTIGGRDYRVVERRPDDLGGIVLQLRLLT